MTDEPCACALSQGSSETREECRERVLAIRDSAMGGHAGQVGREVSSREDDIRAFGEWLDRRLENARFSQTTTAAEDLPEDHPLRRRSEDARSKSPVVVHVPPLLGGTLPGW